MCLRIKNNQEENEKDLKRWFRSRKKFAYVYKILTKGPDEDFYRSEYHLNFKWDFRNQKVFQVNRNPKPIEKELKGRKIEVGLHTYTHLRDIEFWPYKNEAIVKFRVDKKDIVAIENDYSAKNANFKELVCTRLEFVKVL